MAKTSLEIFQEILSRNLLNVPAPVRPPSPQFVGKTKPVRSDFAQYMLAHSQSVPGATSTGKQLMAASNAGEEPGVLSHIIKTLSAPVQTVYAIAEGMADETMDFVKNPSLEEGLDIVTEPIKDIGAGLVNMTSAGGNIPGATTIGDFLPEKVKKWAEEETPNRYGSDVLQDRFGVDNPIGKYGGGFALDVAADPLTYVPGLNVLTWLKKAKAAKAGYTSATDQLAENAAGLTPKEVKGFKAERGYGEQQQVRADTSRLEEIFGRSPVAASQVPPRNAIPKPDLTKLPSVSGQDVYQGTAPKGIFHGTSKAFEGDKVANIYEGAPGYDNLYGQGFYTTNDFRIAEDYTAKGNPFHIDPKILSKEEKNYPGWKKQLADQAAKQTIYKVSWAGKNKPNLYDLDKSADQTSTVRLWAQEQLDNLNNSAGDGTIRLGDRRSLESFREALQRPNVTGGELIIKAQQSLMNSDMSLGEVEEIVGSLSRELSQEGFDGFAHEGGRILGAKLGKQKHGVNIYFDHEKIRLSKAKRGAGREMDPKFLEYLGKHMPENTKPIRTGATVEKQIDSMLQGKLAARGVIVDPLKGKTSFLGARRVVDEIADGKVEEFPPMIGAATGPELKIAVQQADAFVDKLMGSAKNKRSPAPLTPERQMYFFRDMLRTGSSSPLSVLRAAEDHFIKLGVQPLGHNGERMRLSDVLAESAVSGVRKEEALAAFVAKDLRKVSPEARKVIEVVNARRAMAMSDLVANFSNHAAKVKDDIVSNFNFMDGGKQLKALPGQAKEVAVKLGMTEKEAIAIYNLVGHHVNLGNTPIEDLMAKITPELARALQDNRLKPAALTKILAGITKTIGETPERLANDVTGNRVFDWLGTHFSTAFGRGPMKKESQDLFQWKEGNSALRAQTMRNIIKNNTPEEIQRAFLISQNRSLMEGVTDSPKILALADEFTKYMETMLSSSRFEKLVDNEGTVAIRSMMIMADVNKHLKLMGSKFNFIDSPNAKRKVDQFPRDYSEKGHGWMKSWENADPQATKADPVSIIYDIDLAMERTIAEYGLLDSFAAKFGATKASAHYNPKVHTNQVGNSRLDGFFFPKPERDQMIRLLHDLEEGVWAPKNDLLRFISKGTRIWKTGVTIYLPSHHERNAIGDLHLMWWAGHNDPRDFIRAKRLMSSQRDRYKKAIKTGDWETLSQLTSKDAAEWAQTSGSDVMLKRNGHVVTYDEVFIQAHQHGLLPDANSIEDIFGEKLFGAPKADPSWLRKRVEKPLGGVAHKGAVAAAEYREHYIRLAHFSAALNKQLKKTKNLQQAFDDAAHEVRKWHPDGRDLTKFEQQARLLIPFYSWTRKAIPLVIQSAVTRPAKLLYYPRAQSAMQGMLGIETEDRALDPFPEDQVFPDWIRAGGIGPLGDPESSNPISAMLGNLAKTTTGITGQPKGYSVLNPGNPFQDMMRQYVGMGDAEDVGQGILGSMSPGINVPMDLLKGTKFTGAPIYEKDGGMGAAQYLSEQVPIVSAANRMFDVGKDIPDKTEQGFDLEAFINIMTAAGLIGTGPYIKGAEFEADERASLEAKRRKEAAK